MDLQDRLSAELAGRYEIVKEIGRGGMAVVYLARDLKLERQVAIKVLRPEFSASLVAERFVQEIQIAARLEHPLIIPLHESDSSDGLLWYAMPYVHGETLQRRLEREKQLPVDDALRIACEVAQALSYAHAQGVIHRDIKPANILLSDGHPRVADFGIAKAFTQAGGPTRTASAVGIGTPGYMSPEQATGETNIDVRTDVYSLACVLYEMLAGERPYTGPTTQAIIAKQLSLPVPSVCTVRDSVAPALDDVLRRALAKVPADRFNTVGEFADAIATAPRGQRVSSGVRGWLRRHPRLALGGSLAMALIIWAGVSANPPPPSLSPTLLAVAPFDVLDERLNIWREGMVDLLSRSLDGAGPIRTVPPTAVVRRWSGRADQVSAEQLGRATGSGLTVFGIVVPSGSDSVRVVAQVVDVADGRLLGEVDVRDASERLDRIADSLTLGLLRTIGKTRPIGASRLNSLGSTSVSAVKAFLQGEQHFRRTAFDSAAVYYNEAIRFDSTFALPFHRLYRSLVWQAAGGDSAARSYALKAGSLNHSLSRRESLLVSAESLAAGLASSSFASDTAYWSNHRRLFATLQEAARLYPQDPEVWYDLGFARSNFGHAMGTRSADILAAFARSIELDSAFAPAYLYAISVSMASGKASEARRFADAYLARRPTGAQAGGVALFLRLLDMRPKSPEQVQSVLDGASTRVLFSALASLTWSVDPEELGVQVARELVKRSGSLSPQEAGLARFLLAFALAWRGHLREAYEVVGSQPSNLFGALTMLGGVPHDTAAAVYQRLLERDLWPPTRLPVAFPWWSLRSDTASLAAVVQRGDSLARVTADPSIRAYSRRLANAGRAYLLLALGDTAEAVLGLAALPDTACPLCFFDRHTLVDILTRTGREADAAPLLNRELADPNGVQNNPLFVIWHLQRARVAERFNDWSSAAKHYSYVEAAWRAADAVLEPYVVEARNGRQRARRREGLSLGRPPPVGTSTVGVVGSASRR